MPNPAARQRRKNLFRMAKLAEEAQRYDHMLRFMKEIANSTNLYTDLTPKERSLLGAAFKNTVALRRGSLSKSIALTQSMREGISASIASFHLLNCKKEISRICEAAIELIDQRLLPSANSIESKIYYLTLKGDFSWYLAEVKDSGGGFRDAEIARSAYNDAWAFAENLDLINPHRLALKLSVAEHRFRFLNSPLKAVEATEDVVDFLREAALDTRPVASLLSFEGGFQLLWKLMNMKITIRDLLQNIAAQRTAARAPRLPAGDGTGIPGPSVLH